MRKILFGVVITLAVILVFRSCSQDMREQAVLEESTLLIQEQINNVSKLIVTEGHFAEVYNYKDSQQLFGQLLTADKRALVVVNAEVAIAYDLSELDYQIDKENKSIVLNGIPEAEIKINPNFEYYDITSDFFNPFVAEDYNKINDNVRAALLKKIRASSMLGNAQDRLISELSKLYLLTNSMGWQLIYQGQPLDSGFSEAIFID